MHSRLAASHSITTTTTQPRHPLCRNTVSSHCAAMQTTMGMMCLLCCPCPQRGESPSRGGTLPCPPNAHQQSHKPWHPHQIAALPSPRHLQAGPKPTGSYISIDFCQKSKTLCTRLCRHSLTDSSLVQFRALASRTQSDRYLSMCIWIFVKESRYCVRGSAGTH